MNKLYIHAGLPKTGSSALQVFLARNADALRIDGIDYLAIGEFAEGAAGKISSGNGAHIARGLLPDGDVNRQDVAASHLTALLGAMASSACETGLMSGEFFASADPVRLRDFVTMLRAQGATPVLVYFVRAQDQMLASMYVQDVKRGCCRQTPEENVRGRYRSEPYLLHATFYKTMRDIFGADHVICRVYEECLDRPDGLRLALMEAVGATTTQGAPGIAQINTGLSAAEIAVMRSLNKYRPRMQFSDLLVENSRQAGRTASGQTHHILQPTLVAEVNRYFAAENAELAQLVFHRDELFPPPSRLNSEPLSLEDISSQELVDILGGLLVRYDDRLTQLEHRLGRESIWARLRRRLAALQFASAAPAGYRRQSSGAATNRF
jgi:hypothetical protein